jgi:murein L,D-transpeptidase YcbB/YkuD
VIGRDTLQQLGVPFSTASGRSSSLERLRWLPKLPAGHPVIAVNIPSFRLWAFANAGDDTAAQLTMPVIVGRAVTARERRYSSAKCATSSSAHTGTFRLRSCASETVPRLQRDPGYWQSEGFEAVPVREEPRSRSSTRRRSTA